MYGDHETLVAAIVLNQPVRDNNTHLLAREWVHCCSSLCAGASGPADSASRAVPSPAGSRRVHAAGSWRRRSRTRHHPDPTESRHAAEQVGQPQHQDGRPQGKTTTHTGCFTDPSCFCSQLLSSLSMNLHCLDHDCLHLILLVFIRINTVIEILACRGFIFISNSELSRESWKRPFPWQQVSRPRCRTPSTG